MKRWSSLLEFDLALWLVLLRRHWLLDILHLLELKIPPMNPTRHFTLLLSVDAKLYWLQRVSLYDREFGILAILLIVQFPSFGWEASITFFEYFLSQSTYLLRLTRLVFAAGRVFRHLMDASLFRVPLLDLIGCVFTELHCSYVLQLIWNIKIGN